ncbi:MAG: hypothetical protein KDH90_18305, partial [Anaerolineae bacterium]|nr:hypothetical protein [Anaerolineae bacterium]
MTVNDGVEPTVCPTCMATASGRGARKAKVRSNEKAAMRSRMAVLAPRRLLRWSSMSFLHMIA